MGQSCVVWFVNLCTNVMWLFYVLYPDVLTQIHVDKEDYAVEFLAEEEFVDEHGKVVTRNVGLSSSAQLFPTNRLTHSQIDTYKHTYRNTHACKYTSHRSVLTPLSVFSYPAPSLLAVL